MKISREWLQIFFDTSLPDAQALADALTFHAFEIESIGNDVLDVKVTPNRGHDCLSHRSIAKELSAILNMPLKDDPLRGVASLEPKTEVVEVVVDDPKLCPRFTAAYITGLEVGPSPEWLKNRLAAVGQKSINNIVDATNFVMFNIGQPLHAFDASKLKMENGKLKIVVRTAKEGEKMIGLDDKEYMLSASMLVIADGNTGEAVSIAGIKGGKPTGVDEKTTSLILEAANWDGVVTRKTSQALKLRTDASERFQQVISPELAAHGLCAASALIVQLAGGSVVGFVDEYPVPQQARSVSVSTTRINAVLGTSLSDMDVADALKRLDLPFEKNEDMFTVTPPFERLDLVPPAGGPEDLVEEVARIVGYEKIPAAELPQFTKKPEVNANFHAAEAKREELMAQGYSEVYTSVFADTGERAVLNKVGGERPFLRSTLANGLKDALEKNTRNKDLLGLKDVRLFEIGAIWKDGEEVTMVGTADSQGVDEKPLETKQHDAYEDLLVSKTERYQPFSKYPSIARDIALWLPTSTKSEDVLAVIRGAAGELLVRSEKFDEFKKGDKLSLAFRLVFQSFDRTLTDEDANSRMESIYSAVKGKGWEVR